MLRKLRISAAFIFFVLLTLLFLDFTGTIHSWFGWMAKLQFFPALLASNLIVVISIIIITLLLGRLYCSIICPLGIYQDIISWLSERKKKNKYSFKQNRKWLRYGITAAFILLIIFGFNTIALLIAPYSIFGKIASNIFSPIYMLINNVLAYFAERWNSYAFYSVDVYIKSLPIFIISAIYFILITASAIFSGRGYCNTVCPIGTILSVFARHSIFKPHFNDKCVSCGLCEKKCRCSAIDVKNHSIDYSKCVTCFNCIDKCNKGGMSYGRINKSVVKEAVSENDTEGRTSRKAFLMTMAAVAAAPAIKAQEKIFDGGLASIEKKQKPEREVPVMPPGSMSRDNFTKRCVGCQLCVQACPNGVLRPSTSLESFMQPEMSFELGYCRPECNACSQVCPAGAIKPITVEEKTTIQIGRAKWIGRNCVPLSSNIECGNCANHCPSGAITMIAYDPEDSTSPKVPFVDEERCIGCGTCEHVCPARPFSAIYVEGNYIQRTI
ncbi:MAG: 4Fe-4S dicluster domain-containing protein [Candidatus Limimorpha sp.]